MRSQYENISLRLPPAQKLALDRIANHRGQSVVSILRESIAAMTGVPTTIPGKTRRTKRENGRALT